MPESELPRGGKVRGKFSITGGSNLKVPRPAAQMSVKATPKPASAKKPAK